MTSNYICSLKKIENILGWRPRYSFFEGMRETVEWYKKVKTKK